MECGVGMELELDHTQEHFVSKVIIDGDETQIVCSCGTATEKAEDETEARKEYEKHYEKVMN